VKRLIGPQSGKASIFCSDACISRYLRARNWNVKKAAKMLKLTLKWREEYKPEEIRWVSACLSSFCFVCLLHVMHSREGMCPSWYWYFV